MYLFHPFFISISIQFLFHFRKHSLGIGKPATMATILCKWFVKIWRTIIQWLRYHWQKNLRQVSFLCRNSCLISLRVCHRYTILKSVENYALNCSFNLQIYRQKYFIGVTVPLVFQKHLVSLYFCCHFFEEESLGTRLSFYLLSIESWKISHGFYSQG